MKKSLKKSLASLLALVMMLSSAPMLAAVPGATSTYPGSSAYNSTMTKTNNNYLLVDRGADATAVPTAPAENLFTVGGKTYNMLDTDADGNYFIMTDFGVGATQIDAFYTGSERTYAAMRFNAESSESVGSRLQARMGTYVPSAQMQAQVLNYTWYDEHDPQDNQNYTTCKLAYPSVTEINTYKDEINWQLIDGSSYGYMPTRTVGYNSSDSQYYIIGVQHYGKPRYEFAMWTEHRRSGAPNAPAVFFLDKDFFKTVKVDLSANVGANVLSEIKKYTVDDLSGIYTDDELISLGYTLDDEEDEEIGNSTYPGSSAYNSTMTKSDNWTMIDRGADATAVPTAPAENLFTVGGKKYNMLDTDADGNYFIMTDFGVGATNIDAFYNGSERTYAAMRFNAESSESVGNRLQARMGTYIPSAEMQAQVLNYTWYDEHDPQDNQNYTTCKLAYPSLTELNTYKDEINWQLIDGSSYGYMPTRTIGYNSTDSQYYIIGVKHFSKPRYEIAMWTEHRTSGAPNAPAVFFLDKDFFKTVKIDISAGVGANVLAELSKYQVEDLTSIYTLAELAGLGFDVGVEDNSDQVPTEYRTAIKNFTQNTAMLDKDGTAITSTHEKYENTSSDYTFKVGGTEFVLLGDDASDDHFVTFKTPKYETSSVKLWADKTSADKEDYVFSVSNTNSIASTLNESSWINSNIPVDMQSQLKEKEWWTEHDVVAYEDINVWKTTAKIALPSYAEIKAHSDRFPFGSVWEGAREWIRSFNISSTGAIQAVGLIDEESTIKASVNAHYISLIRPVFYLDKDFFKNVKVDDIAALGSGIKDEIVANYEIEDLLGLYTANELVEIGYNAQSVQIAADRVLSKGYPTVDSYKAAFTGTQTIGSIVAGATTPAENLFKVGDKEFIYLDADNAGNMFVMANAYHSKEEVSFPSTATTNEEKIYDASRENSIAWNFNSEAYIDSIVPTILQGYLIDYNWYVETDNTTPYYTTAKVALPSATEILKYWNKIGGWSGLNMANSNTRTPYYKNGEHLTNIYVWVDNVTTPDDPKLKFNKIETDPKCNKHRPVFFIDKYYFLDHAVNPDDLGDNVKQFIRASFTKDELKTNGYDEATLIALGYAAAPSAAAIVIDAPAFADGQTLTASYTYVPDATEMPEVTTSSVYQWYRSSDANTYTAISGATGLSYTLTSDDVGKYIKFGVKPANLDCVATTEYFSNPTIKIAEAPKFLFGVALKDAQGNDVEDINGETSLTAVLTIENLKAAGENKALIIAVYDDKNTLKAFNVEEPLISVGEDDYPITVSGFTGATGWTAKVMVWDTLVNMVPLFGKSY